MLLRELSTELFWCSGGLATYAARSRCSGARDQPRQLGGEHGEEAAEVVGVPCAGEVGLAEADQAVAADPGEELVGAVDGHLGAAPAQWRDVPRPARCTVTGSRLTAAVNRRRAMRAETSGPRPGGDDVEAWPGQ